VSSFKKTSILKSFEVTGIWPMDSNIILKRFAHMPELQKSLPFGPSDNDWIQMERLVPAAMKETQQEEAKKLSLSLHHLSVQNHLLKHENMGSRENLYT
jgi:hypothetical protein